MMILLNDLAVPPIGAPADDGNNDVSRIINFGKSTVTSISGFRWNCRPQTSTSVRTVACNMRGYTPGPVPEARSADTPEKAMNLMFGDDINEIVKWTNVIIPREAAKYDYHKSRMVLLEPD